MLDKDYVKLLQKHGWLLMRVKGSHHTLRKNGQTITVPVHGKDLKPGMYAALRRQTGI